MRRLVLALPLVALLAACGTDDDDTGGAGDTLPIVTDSGDTGSSATTPPSAPPLKETPVPPDSPPVSSALPGTPIDPTMPLVTAAVEDLAGRLGIEPDAVMVVDARAVTWPDGSLGCPEPGMMYTQVLVDGTLVVLEAGGSRYEYHGGDPLLLCEHPTPPSGGG